QVRSEDAFPVLQRRFSQRSPAKVSHIVDDDIDSPEPIDHRFDQLVATPGIGDVRLDGHAIRPVCLQLTQRLLCGNFIGAIGDGHSRSILRQPQSEPAANASAPASYQCHSIAKRHSSPRQISRKYVQYSLAATKVLAK